MSWPTVKLATVAKFTSGGTPDRQDTSYYSGDIPWITGADITLNGTVSPRSRISAEAVKKSATTLVDAGTILLVTRTSIGKAAIAPFPLCFSQDITGISLDATRANSAYFVRLIEARARYFEQYARGATIKGVTRSIVENLDVPLPSLVEQKRIAEVLDGADALRAMRRRTIALLDDLTQSVFLDMFGDPASEWPNVTVADAARDAKDSIRTGPFGSQLLHEEFVESGVPVLGIDNAVNNEFRWKDRRFISDDKYRQLRRYTVHPGDVLITIMGTCGRCAIVPDDIPTAINTKHLCCITLDQEKCIPRFLHSYFLMHPIARRYLGQTAKGAIMEGLNTGVIKALPLALPPVDLQRAYAERVEAIEVEKAKHRAHLARLDELFSSVQSRAFAGTLFG